MVATSVIATPAIDAAAIRFPQRLVGVILGMSLAVVFTAIFLPELERIQEFELWIFGGFWVCSLINSRGGNIQRSFLSRSKRISDWSASR